MSRSPMDTDGENIEQARAENNDAAVDQDAGGIPHINARPTNMVTDNIEGQDIEAVDIEQARAENNDTAVDQDAGGMLYLNARRSLDQLLAMFNTAATSCTSWFQNENADATRMVEDSEERDVNCPETQQMGVIPECVHSTHGKEDNEDGDSLGLLTPAAEETEQTSNDSKDGYVRKIHNRRFLIHDPRLSFMNREVKHHLLLTDKYSSSDCLPQFQVFALGKELKEIRKDGKSSRVTPSVARRYNLTARGAAPAACRPNALLYPHDLEE